MKVGDLVKMKRGYSPPGIITKVVDFTEGRFLYRDTKETPVSVHIEWPDGKSVEIARDLEVVNESR